MNTTHFFHPEGIAIAIAVVTQTVAVLRWLYTKQRNAEIQAAFIRSMALNHLPHIQDALYKIASRVGLELPAPPPIEWVDLNGKK